MSPRALLLLVVAFPPRPLTAQGVTTAAVQGTVLRQEGAPVAGATVRLTNTSDGRRWEVATSAAGRYVLEDVGIGGPYALEVRALGFAAATRTGILLALGERLVADFVLRPAAVELSPITVAGSADRRLSASRTGPADVISTEMIAALPNPGRDFLALAALSPQVASSPSSRFAPTGGISIGSQNRLYNRFQIDGGVNHDLYTGRLPGRETLPRPISLEALEAVQVLPASFDVRHGASAGGLVNAVTRSGVNVMRGSVFGSLADGTLMGRHPAGRAKADFATWQYGGSVGGPIVRDRLHYFLSVDVQHRLAADPGPLIGDRARAADTLAVRFQSILRDTFGLDPGVLRLDARMPAQDVFGKVTAQLGANSHLEVSHHYSHGDRHGLLDRATPDLYELSSTAQHQLSAANASRIIWRSVVAGRWSSELIVSYLDLRDACRPRASYPLTVVRPNRESLALTAGTSVVCPRSSAFAQRALEVTPNLTLAFAAHVVTLGAYGELLAFSDDQIQGSAGLWNFESLDSLAVGRAYHYERSLPGPLRTGGIEFRGRGVGVYVQDRWNPTPQLTVTTGLRVDVPLLPDAIPTNDSLQAALGIDTGRLPGGNLLWSPRLGVNYDLHGAGRTLLRGGVGLFRGIPPFVWIGNAYRGDGMRQLSLVCDADQVPKFDPVNQPSACANGVGPRPLFAFFAPGVRSPQNLNVALGVDHLFPAGLAGTIDFLYTRAARQLYVTDANLLPSTGAAPGEGGRLLYGTLDGTATSKTVSPARRRPALRQVIEMSNRSGDHALSFSAELRKRFGDRAEASVLYAYSRAWDRMSLVNLLPRPNLELTPLDGTLERRRLRTSFFERPHRALVSALVRLPFRVQLSLLYAGSSGTPFTYVIDGDANADGIGTGPQKNDMVYVPRDSLDVALATPADWPQLDAFIRAEPCLREQRGRILERNSCRNPWFGTLSARLAKTVPSVAGQSVELTADVYNVLNLLSRRWGQYRITTLDPRVVLLSLVGYDTARERGVYQWSRPARNQLEDLESRWQIVLGARYKF